MVDRLHGFTEKQVDRLSRAVRKVETLLPDRTPHEHLPGDPPVWIYVGRTQSTIPPIAGNKPGKGTVQVYKLNIATETLTQVQYSLTAYSTLCDYIPSGAWVILDRDPYSGKYFCLYHICEQLGGCCSAGCGIEINNGVISVKAKDLAGDGLKAADEGCALDVNPGCGLTIDGDAVAVDTYPTGSCSVEMVTDVTLGLDGQTLSLTKEFAILTLLKNDCDVVIDCSIDGHRLETNSVTGCWNPCMGSGSGEDVPPGVVSSGSGEVIVTRPPGTGSGSGSGGMDNSPGNLLAATSGVVFNEEWLEKQTEEE